jgi:signal peptidase
MLLLPSILGYQRYAITGGSMTGTIDKGSLIYAELVPVSSLHKGDIVTFKPPQGFGKRGTITHRIVWIGRNNTGKPVFRTRGDANDAQDPWKLSFDKSHQPRYAAQIPYVGYMLEALGIRWVRILAVGLPALAIAITILLNLWREAGQADEQQPKPESEYP